MALSTSRCITIEWIPLKADSIVVLVETREKPGCCCTGLRFSPLFSVFRLDIKYLLRLILHCRHSCPQPQTCDLHLHRHYSQTTMSNLPIGAPRGLKLNDRDLIYECGPRKVWKIDNALIVKKTPYKPNSEVETHRYVRAKTNIPVPKVYDEWLSADRRSHYILEDCVQGVPLKDCWSRLSRPARMNIAYEVAEYMEELGKVRQQVMGSVSGKKLPNNLFVPDPNHGPLIGMWQTDDEIFENEFRPALRKLGANGDVIRLVHRTMPPSRGRFYATHGDLYIGNIMVDPRRSTVTAIIDWESAGFWPIWFQFARMSFGCTPADEEWKKMLRRIQEDHIPGALHGLVWWNALLVAMQPPHSPEQGIAWLRYLERYLNGANLDLRNYESVRPRSFLGRSLNLGQSFMNSKGERGDEGYYSQAYSILRRGQF